jgi:hypothetical protein
MPKITSDLHVGRVSIGDKDEGSEFFSEFGSSVE